MFVYISDSCVCYWRRRTFSSRYRRFW